MGMIYIDGTVRGPQGYEDVQFLVDTGTGYTLLPTDVWQKIGLEPKRTQTFVLVDGSKIDRAVSECHISLPDGDTHTPVILGEPGDEALLGTVTLEELGLVLHPFSRRLRKMRMLLA